MLIVTLFITSRKHNGLLVTNLEASNFRSMYTFVGDRHAVEQFIKNLLKWDFFVQLMGDKFTIQTQTLEKGLGRCK